MCSFTMLYALGWLISSTLHLGLCQARLAWVVSDGEGLWCPCPSALWGLPA